MRKKSPDLRRAAVFLDRDGTIIFDTGYIGQPEEVKLLPGSAAALQSAANAGLRLYLVTNQSGINRGFYPLENAIACNERLMSLLNLPKSGFSGICIAPERPDELSVYRKPSPAYILEKISTDKLDPNACFMIGDKPTDLMCGVNAGIHPMLVAKDADKFNPDAVKYAAAHGIPMFRTLAEALSKIIDSDK